MSSELLAKLLPLAYAACFLGLLWQAFRIMGRGFAAVPRPGDQNRIPRGDRTGRLTIHPELLDADGQLTRDDLLTVRSSWYNRWVVVDTAEAEWSKEPGSWLRCSRPSSCPLASS
jgi:hypothetical protein